MADIDKIDEKEVTAPLSVKQPDAPAAPEVAGEEDQTAKIQRPVKPVNKPVVPLAGSDDAVPLTPTEDKEQTAKIPKLPKPGGSEEDDKKIVLNSATDSTIKPSDITTMAPAAIDIRKTESGNLEVVDTPASLTAEPPAQATVAPEGSTTKGRKTIKLKPLKKEVPEEDENAEETLSMDRSELIEGEGISSLAGGAPAKAEAPKAPVAKENLEDESTVKIQKPQITKPAHPTPIVPGSKETIKLRPSTTPPPPGADPVAVTQTEPAAADESEETLAVSKKTIRLVPKKPGEDDSTQKTPKQDAATPAAAAAAAAKPSAPTIKQKPTDDVTQKTARPSAPTVKLPQPAAEPEADKTAASSKKTLKLKATPSATPPPAATGGGMPPPAGASAAKGAGAVAPGPVAAAKGADPGVVMTLVAVLALFAIAYYAWMVGGQWAEQYAEVESANVPALSGTVK